MDCYIYFVRSFPEKEDVSELKSLLTSKGYNIKGIIFKKDFIREKEGISIVIDPACSETCLIDSYTIIFPYNPLYRDYDKLKSLETPYILRLFDVDKNRLLSAIKGKECSVEFRLSGIDIYTYKEEEFLKIREELREYVYAESYKSMEEVVVGTLKKNKKTVALAESCTGGMISSRIVNVPGSSEVFLGGFLVYSNDFKERFLGVNKHTLERYGAVSEEVCREMLKGTIERAGSDLAIAVTGIAGPGGTERKPQGLTYIGVGDIKSIYIDKRIFNSTRNINRFLASQVALNNLRKFIEGVPK